MAVTLKRIAELAGVSIGTVDRALHHRSGIKPDVAKRILEIADSLGYKPNIMAKALVIKRSNLTIGVIFHVHKNPFYESVMEGINAALESIVDFGISVLVRQGKDFDADDQLRLIDELVDEGVNAIVIVPLNDDRIAQRINKLHADNFPVILLSSDLEKAQRLAYVGCDVFKVGSIAGGLTGIINNGKGNVLYATSHLSMLGNLQRLKGFQSALQLRYPQIKLVDVCEFDNDDILSYKKAVSIFNSASNIDSIMIATGFLNGIFLAIQESPLAGKVKVIALDLGQQVIEGLKSSSVIAIIAQHPYTQGYQAITALSNYFISGAAPPQHKCLIPSDIQIYESLF